MTLPRNPQTGWPIPNQDAIMRKPGTVPNQTAPVWAAADIKVAKINATTADAVWRSILRQTWEQMGQGRRVTWPGFFAFTPFQRAPRNRINPRTGDINPAPGYQDISERMATAWRKKMNGII